MNKTPRQERYQKDLTKRDSKTPFKVFGQPKWVELYGEILKIILKQTAVEKRSNFKFIKAGGMYERKRNKDKRTADVQ